MIEFSILKPEDIQLAKDLFRYYQEEFSDEQPQLPSDDRLQAMLSDKDFFVFVALENGQLAGGITAYRLFGYRYEIPELFLYDVAIKPDFRRKGIASKLLHYIRAWCQENGFADMFVFAEKVDAHAVNFYESVPDAMRTDAVMFSYTTSP